MNTIILALISSLALATASAAAPPAPPKEAPPQSVGAERLQLPASRGGINFPHRKHQQMLKDCSTCHNIIPGKIADLGKEWAHATCRGCHHDTARAPVQCTGCHGTAAVGGN